MEPPTGKENVLQDVALEIDALLSGVPELSPSGSAATKPAQDAAGADLLGLSLDDEFSDFMSAPAPFLPSALLTNCILTDDGAFDFSASLPPDHGDPLQALQASDAEQPTANSASSKSSEKATDIFSSLLQSFSKQGSTTTAGNSSDASAGAAKQGKPTSGSSSSSKTTGKDLSGWYQLFAELDPLSNPDAIPSKTDAPNNSMAA